MLRQRKGETPEAFAERYERTHRERREQRQEELRVRPCSQCGQPTDGLFSGRCAACVRESNAKELEVRKRDAVVRQQEREAQYKLALELIKAGYERHPDRGTTELKRTRDRLRRRIDKYFTGSQYEV